MWSDSTAFLAAGCSSLSCSSHSDFSLLLFHSSGLRNFALCNFSDRYCSCSWPPGHLPLDILAQMLPFHSAASDRWYCDPTHGNPSATVLVSCLSLYNHPMPKPWMPKQKQSQSHTQSHYFILFISYDLHLSPPKLPSFSVMGLSKSIKWPKG